MAPHIYGTPPHQKHQKIHPIKASNNEAGIYSPNRAYHRLKPEKTQKNSSCTAMTAAAAQLAVPQQQARPS